MVIKWIHLNVDMKRGTYSLNALKKTLRRNKEAKRTRAKDKTDYEKCCVCKVRINFPIVSAAKGTQKVALAQANRKIYTETDCGLQCKECEQTGEFCCQPCMRKVIDKCTYETSRSIFTRTRIVFDRSIL